MASSAANDYDPKIFLYSYHVIAFLFIASGLFIAFRCGHGLSDFSALHVAKRHRKLIIRPDIKKVIFTIKPFGFRFSFQITTIKIL